MGMVEGENAGALSVSRIEQAIRDRVVSWELLLEIGGVYGYPDDVPEAPKTFEHFLTQAIEIYKQEWGGDAEIYPPLGGIYLHGDGEFEWTIAKEAISFDCSQAWPLTFQIELMAEEALEWWPDPDDDADADRPTERHGLFARASGYFRRMVGSGRNAAARGPHLKRIFGLATWILAAMQQENVRQSLRPSDDGRPGQRFLSALSQCQMDFATAQSHFREAIQRTAQSRYWQGAIAGTFLLAFFCVLIGGIFWWRGTDAAYGVALPAGGLGALVSVLQRMSSGKLVLDVNASRDLLEVFGMVRPLIGAVFGLAIVALLAGGLVPAIEIPKGQELAFFAGVGFLAGFNERWAQDMLKSSTDRVEDSMRAARVELTGDGAAVAEDAKSTH